MGKIETTIGILVKADQMSGISIKRMVDCRLNLIDLSRSMQIDTLSFSYEWNKNELMVYRVKADSKNTIDQNKFEEVLAVEIMKKFERDPFMSVEYIEYYKENEEVKVYQLA